VNRFQQAIVRKIVRALLILAVASTVQPAQPQTNSTSGSKSTFSRRSLPLTKFYDTPIPFPADKPGNLIRLQEFDAYDLPLHVLAVRILYHSSSATGQDVAVSGVVLYPDSKPPAGGFPVLAWAHALNGVARQCAPSLARNLQSGPALAMFVNLGYAVVLTDYAGLGSNSRNAFSDLPSNATDLINSVPAARAAVPQLGSRWMAVGSGYGGSVVVEAAEIEHDLRDSGYLGGVAISGLEESFDAAGTAVPGPPLFLTYGIKTVYREFNEKDVLTEKALALYSRVEQSCAEPGGPSPVSAEMLKPNWASNNFVKMFFSRNTLGEKPAQGPILVIDPGLPKAKTIQAINRLCQQGDRVDLARYAQSDPASVFGDSVRDQIAWIQARFAGRPAATSCPAHP
jgi:hypothetical protein